MKKICVTALSVVFVFLFTLQILAAGGLITISVDPSIQILVDGKEFQPKDAKGKDVMTFVYNGTTYAPLRALAEAFGLEVGYNAEKNMATVGERSPYAAPAKVAEVYDAKAKNRPLKVLGASHSDGDYCVLFGECAVGTTISATNDSGTFSVVSEGGSFALRFQNPGGSAQLDVVQKANGEQIGGSVHWEGNIIQPSCSDDWGVWIGYENQCFYKKMIPDFTHTNRLSQDVVKSITDRYTERVNKLKTVGDGCEMVFVLVPASMTVYPELVPEEVAKPGTGDSRFDQVADALTAAGATVIDMRDTFSKRKNDALPLYFQNDSHWTDYGAYLAYVDLFTHIAEKYPDASPKTFDAFEWQWGYYTRGDMPWYFDIDQGGKVYEYTFQRIGKLDTPAANAIERFPTKNWSLAYAAFSGEIQGGGTYHTDRATLPDIMVMRNSYGAYLYDLLVDASDSAYMMPSFSYTFNFAQIQKNDPDYLIYVLSEWDFQGIINT